ncbi:uncharacterized protein EDB91DRAFT_1254921 [Suillus paluster]|uniref:uncharacterized protein n=1 Tax=Suillus paluster TaxID=48578 RepID=UPI001B86BFA4|nr:uncharacterized protein EDB91DRAFT_1254921 [Suillus paluster]KAG1725061.1 hypothetical protein EDB91DRAFT_1254921 [Suillus paluster]
MDGRLQLSEEPEISCVDCTLSSAGDHFSNDQASPMATASHFERRESDASTTFVSPTPWSVDPPSPSPIITPNASEPQGTQTFNILTTTITSLGPLPTVTSTSIVMVPSPFPQPTPVTDTSSKFQSRPTTGAIVGGTVGAVALLALLLFIVLWRRRKQQLSVTPFNLLSTAGPTQVESRVQLKLSTSGAVRPSSTSSSFIQYSDACLAEYSVNRCSSCATDPISYHFPN